MSLAALDEMGYVTPAGVSVSPIRAMRDTAVLACVRVISETVAALPFPVVQDEGPARVELKLDPRWPLLNTQANPEMSAMELLEGMLAWPNLYARSYTYIERDNADRPLSLWPLPPQNTRRWRAPDGKITYSSMLPSGQASILRPQDVIDLPAFLGMAPIDLARSAIGTKIAADEFAGRFWANDARPGGILSFADADPTEDEVKEIKRRWESGHRGLKRSQLIGILTGGATWQDVSVPNDAAQFLQTRMYGVTDIARLFRVPPYLIADLQPGSVSYKSVEQQQLDFLTHCLRPWIRRLMQVVNNRLFQTPVDLASSTYATIRTKPLLLGDLQQRALYFGHAIQYGWMSPADVREEDDLSFVEGLDTYYSPASQLPVAGTTELPETEELAEGTELERMLLKMHGWRNELTEYYEQNPEEFDRMTEVFEGIRKEMAPARSALGQQLLLEEKVLAGRNGQNGA
jgi:HK97 family phage portal protein